MHEDRERALLHQLQGVEPEDVAHADLVPELGRRGVRQRQRVEAERDGGRRGQLELQRDGFGVQQADGEPGGNPADRPEHPDARELLAGIGHLMERQRVGQRQRRHVAQRVAEQDRVEAAEVGEGRDPQQQRGAKQVQEREDALGREEPVGDQPDEEGGHHGGQRRGAVRDPALLPREPQRLQQVGAHRHVPGSPDEILQEHHYRQLDLRLVHATAAPLGVSWRSPPATPAG